MKRAASNTEPPQQSQIRAAIFERLKASLLLFCVAALLAGGVEAVRGQSALDGFDPNPNSVVLAVVVQPDGKILMGGGFTTLSPNGGIAVTRNRMARLNPDGSLDTAFDPNANSDVNTIALQADGKILVGGFFTSVGGQTRNRIARLNPDGTLDTTFNPNASAAVRSIVVQGDGQIVAGGQFTTIGGQTRNRIARLDATTGLADAFNPNANSTVFAIALQPDGKMVVGGFFTSIGGQTRNRIARLDPATGAADSFDPNASGAVFAIALQADGKILAGGDFNGANSIGGQTRNRIARLDPGTGAADSFNPNANFGVFTIAVQTDGKILAGGDFNGISSIGGAARNNIARLDPATGAADSFDPKASALASVYAIAVQPDGKVLVGGNFNTLAPNGGAVVTRNHIARLESNGLLDRALNPGIVGDLVFSTAVQPDGKILIGGVFTSVLGVGRNRMARLNADGTLDMTFNPNPDADVLAIAVQPDGKILVGGNFTFIGGAARNRIARLTTSGAADLFNPNANGRVLSISVQADGKILVGGNFFGTNSIGGEARSSIARLDPTTGLADSFNPRANGEVSAMAVQPDGKIVVGGFFTAVGGQARNHIARLDATTGAADSFNPSASGGPLPSVQAIAVQTDGKILAGGGFTSIGGQARNNIARLDAATGLADPSFDPNANSFVFSIALQADGKILVGGDFNGSLTSIGGQPRNYIARLDPTTGFADSFDPNANRDIFSIAVQTDGKILAGGQFTSIGGQTRNAFARLRNDTAALQNLAVADNSVIWTRGGSSPQLARVTFDFSTNNVNYVALSNGTPAGSDWTLTGLNLLTGQNIYIRARGYYRSGQYNGSESSTELVRNAFLAQRPVLSVQRGANTNLVLSWGTNFTGFTLEANADLATNGWSVVSAAPAVSGTNNVVTNLLSGPTGFYRLRK